CHSRDRTTNKIHCVYFIAERQSPIQRPFVIPAFLFVIPASPFVIPAQAGIQTYKLKSLFHLLFDDIFLNI
ncbi:MAG: hypothetical protein LBB59_05075, partial [Campylobacteraceae bacterium]|nr:hypothetical protein [Campylobacteraceae bacterium]